MLNIQGISLAYADDPILRDVSFTVSQGDRLGLVGRNGSGKSTLLRAIAGEMTPDTGVMQRSPHCTVAYLPQYPQDEMALTAGEALARGAGPAGMLHLRIEQLEQKLARVAGGTLESTLLEYAEVREQYERLDGYALESRIKTVLEGLGLDIDLERRLNSLSGGQRTKLLLARLLLTDANLLLLDEPTNFLDLPALLWLERFIALSCAAYIIVSHDRRFLDRTVDAVLELDGQSRALRVWSGRYSDYERGRQAEQQIHTARYRDQQEEIRRVREDVYRNQSWAGRDRLAVNAARAAVVRKRKLARKLDTEYTLDKPVKGWNLHLTDLGHDPIKDNRRVLELEDVRAGYGGREVLRGVDLLVRGQDRVALLGANGSGKSTLLRCIEGGQPCAGRIRFGSGIRMGRLAQEADDLPAGWSPLQLFQSRAEMLESEARTYLHRFLFSGHETLKPIKALSYGQRAKLALAVMIAGGANFLVLDEPTAYMDIPAIEAIEHALAAFQGPMLLVSHDRMFVDRVGITRSVMMRNGVLEPIESMETYEGLVRGDAQRMDPCYA